MTFTPNTRLGLVGGSERSEIDVPFLKEGDVLINVLFFSSDGTNITGVEDLTEDYEFEEEGKLVRRESSGVDTSGGTLLVLYWSV